MSFYLLIWRLIKKNIYIIRNTLHWYNGKCGLGKVGGLEASPSKIKWFISFEFENRVSVYRLDTYDLLVLSISCIFFGQQCLSLFHLFTFTSVCLILKVWIGKMRGGDLLPVMNLNYVHVLVIKLYLWFSPLRLQRQSIIFY